jgi:hypothetical protein
MLKASAAAPADARKIFFIVEFLPFHRLLKGKRIGSPSVLRHLCAAGGLYG